GTDPSPILSCLAAKCSSADVGIFSPRPQIDRQTHPEKARRTDRAHERLHSPVFFDKKETHDLDCRTIRRPVMRPRDSNLTHKKAQRLPGWPLQRANKRGFKALARHSRRKKSKLLQNAPVR
ncbi:hypothetical protein, partial [Pseudomonas amygdali]|uniref:hypothetical protein n=1 Tax=Pseudomonas amygdali TaxID=47877 RepID=UPI001EE45AB1